MIAADYGRIRPLRPSASARLGMQRADPPARAAPPMHPRARAAIAAGLCGAVGMGCVCAAAFSPAVCTEGADGSPGACTRAARPNVPVDMRNMRAVLRAGNCLDAHSFLTIWIVMSSLILMARRHHNLTRTLTHSSARTRHRARHRRSTRLRTSSSSAGL